MQYIMPLLILLIRKTIGFLVRLWLKRKTTKRLKNHSVVIFVIF